MSLVVASAGKAGPRLLPCYCGQGVLIPLDPDVPAGTCRRSECGRRLELDLQNRLDAWLYNISTRDLGGPLLEEFLPDWKNMVLEMGAPIPGVIRLGDARYGWPKWADGAFMIGVGFENDHLRAWLMLPREMESLVRAQCRLTDFGWIR